MNIKELRIIYMGTPAFSALLLTQLIKEGYNIVGVVTREDALVGRKRILTPSPVKSVASENNIPVFTPHRIRDDFNFVLELKSDIIITFAYGQIVPNEVLNAPALLVLIFTVQFYLNFEAPHQFKWRLLMERLRLVFH